MDIEDVIIHLTMMMMIINNSSIVCLTEIRNAFVLPTHYERLATAPFIYIFEQWNKSSLNSYFIEIN